MQTSRLIHYSIQFGCALFAFGFLGISFYALIEPSSVTVRHNNDVVDSTFENLLPFLGIGLIFFLLWIWFVRKFHLTHVSDKAITFTKFGRKSVFDWQDISGVYNAWLPPFRNMVFQIVANNGKSFYTFGAIPTRVWSDFPLIRMDSEMAMFLRSKKDQLNREEAHNTG